MSLIRGAGSMSAIEITRQDLSISQLRAEAARTADAKQARRILAIAMVLDEHPRLLAAQPGGGSPDAARLGSSLQRRRLGGARGPAPAWASAAFGRSPIGAAELLAPTAGDPFQIELISFEIPLGALDHFDEPVCQMLVKIRNFRPTRSLHPPP